MIFFLYCLKTAHPCSRFAVSVSSKIGNSVQRNYMKRLMREWFRTRQNMMVQSFDIWISIKKRFDRQSAREVESAFAHSLKQIFPS